jgi:polar amino acid transport system substrate-binding protein
MAARPYRLIYPVLLTALTVWVWLLVAITFGLRWFSVERPGPPVRELFPHGEMRVGVDASYAPFAVATADDLFGLDIDLGRAIAAHLNVPVRFVNMGFDGLYDSLKTDQVDVLISALLTDYSRTDDVLYTLPYYNAGLVLVSAPGQAIRDYHELEGVRLALEFGSEADQLARRWQRRTAFDRLPYELPGYALDSLRLHQADAALVDATSARLYQRAHPGWAALLNPMTDSLYVMATRRDRSQTWAAINQALAELLDDGTVEALLAKWL